MILPNNRLGWQLLSIVRAYFAQSFGCIIVHIASLALGVVEDKIPREAQLLSFLLDFRIGCLHNTVASSFALQGTVIGMPFKYIPSGRRYDALVCPRCQTNTIYKVLRAADYVPRCKYFGSMHCYFVCTKYT